MTTKMLILDEAWKNKNVPKFAKERRCNKFTLTYKNVFKNTQKIFKNTQKCI